MKKVQIILILLLGIAVAQNNPAQNKNVRFVSGGVVNGKATSLPKPHYSQEAKDFCAGGQVKVEVLIDEVGNVMTAAAISGDELLRDSAVEAAKKAKFSPTMEIPVKVKGIVVYNFVPEKKCIDIGIVNRRARLIPKPAIQLKPLRLKREQIVAVQIIIDPGGNVTSARAIYGHPMLRGACLDSARQIKFTSPAIDGAVITIRGLIIYKFKPDRTIDTNIDSKDRNLIKTIRKL